MCKSFASFVKFIPKHFFCCLIMSAWVANDMIIHIIHNKQLSQQ